MNIGPRSIVLLSMVALLSACQKEEEARPEPLRPVLSLVVQPTPELVFSLPGTVEARIRSELGFRVLGRMIALNVNVGDLVKKGDVLAAIDPLSFELAVRSAQSDLANSEARLANARITEERQRTLFARQSGAKATFEAAEQELKTAEAGVARAQANLDKANEQLSYARLLAEFDGVVTATSADVGQVVSAGQSVVTVTRPDERDAVIDVPEAVGLLPEGTVFDVVLQLAPGIHAQGIVREIAPEADSATRTRRTRLTLINPPEALRLGAVVTASAVVKTDSVIRVPASAILTQDGKTFVWAVNEAEGKVVSRPVILGSENAETGKVIVTDGISPGERIVVAGVNKLKDGQAVRMDQEIIK